MVELIDPKDISKTCSNCGNKEHLELKDRMFHCSKCDISIDRDFNATLNIRNISIEYQKRLKTIIELGSTSGTGDIPQLKLSGRAWLRCPGKESMIQDALAFRKQFSR